VGVTITIDAKPFEIHQVQQIVQWHVAAIGRKMVPCHIVDQDVDENWRKQPGKVGGNHKQNSIPLRYSIDTI